MEPANSSVCSTRAARSRASSAFANSQYSTPKSTAAPSAKTNAYWIARRSARDWRSRSNMAVGAKDVAHAPHRLDALVVAIDLGAQTGHDDVDHVGLRIKAVVPHVLQDHRLAHRPTGVPEQKSQERKFPRLQLHALTGAGHLPRDEIQRHVARHQT